MIKFCKIWKFYICETILNVDLIYLTLILTDAPYYLNLFCKNYISTTLPTRPNLTESKPKLNPRFTFWIYSGLNPALLNWTRSKTRVKPRVRPKWTLNLNSKGISVDTDRSIPLKDYARHLLGIYEGQGSQQLDGKIDIEYHTDVWIWSLVSARAVGTSTIRGMLQGTRSKQLCDFVYIIYLIPMIFY